MELDVKLVLSKDNVAQLKKILLLKEKSAEPVKVSKGKHLTTKKKVRNAMGKVRRSGNAMTPKNVARQLFGKTSAKLERRVKTHMTKIKMGR